MVNNKIFEKYCSAETLKRIVDYPSVSAMWKSCTEMYADRSAVVDGEDLTFLQLEEQVALLRGKLVSLGLVRGDNVGIYCPNSAFFVKAFLATTTLGLCAVLLPPQLPDMAVLGCSMKYNLKALIYGKELETNTGILKEKRPDFRFICSDEVLSGNGVTFVEVKASEPCTIVFTGGTTGKSKGALLSNGAIMRGVKNGCYGYDEIFDQRYMQILPMTHVFGLIRTMLSALYTGSSLWVCRNNKDMFKDIAVHKPTVLIMVPALAELALNISRQFGKNMLGTVKTIIAGAAVVPPYLVREYAKYGITVFPGYGLTESANLVSGNPECARKPSAVGFVYPDMEVKIADGELWLKGPNMFSGYVGEPEENELAFEDGWFKTGDLVRFDEEGLLYITGRKKEVIVLSSGENISPAELETKFNELDCIQDSLVYSSSDNGREILAVQVLPRMAVVKANGVTDVRTYIKEQINSVNATLPSYQKVSKIIVREQDFVRTPSMKIARGKNGEN